MIAVRIFTPRVDLGRGTRVGDTLAKIESKLGTLRCVRGAEREDDNNCAFCTSPQLDFVIFAFRLEELREATVPLSSSERAYINQQPMHYANWLSPLAFMPTSTN